MARLAVLQRAPLRAARLLGAAAAACGLLPGPRNVVDHATDDEIEGAARAALGDDAFRAARDAGRALDLEAAIEYALAEPKA
jgi:hypothetical protein